MNYQKLASLCKCSIGTVSKAFSNSKEISEKTRELIFKVAKENGCFEKYNKNRTSKKVIAILCPEIVSEYYAKIVSKLEELLEENNFLTVISQTKFSSKKVNELYSYYASYKNVDGIITINISPKLKSTPNIPVIVLGNIDSSPFVDSVCIDNKDAYFNALSYLKNMGHTQIGFIGEKLTFLKQQEFIKNMRLLGLPINNDYIIISEERFESAGFNAVNKIYSLKNKPTAIMTAYDHIALGAIQAIKLHGDSVPETFSLIGFDDIPVSSHPNISLTTIKDNVDDACSIAVDLLIKKLNNKYFITKQDISIKSQLIIRSSVKKIDK